MPEIDLTAGMGASPMPGGFTMEHGIHSQPIGELDVFNTNVSPDERRSSVDWSNDPALDGPPNEIGDSREAQKGDGDADFDDVGAAADAVFAQGMGHAGGGPSMGMGIQETGAGISRLSTPTYGPANQTPYQV